MKNKFYSILRRGLKYINSAIKSKLKRYKPLDIDIVYKIVARNRYKWFGKSDACRVPTPEMRTRFLNK